MWIDGTGRAKLHRPPEQPLEVVKTLQQNKSLASIMLDCCMSDMAYLQHVWRSKARGFVVTEHQRNTR
jgi:hypothetical protein